MSIEKIPFKVILTGYQPWGDNKTNPSEILAEKVSEKLREDGNNSESYSLKVTVDEANSFYHNLPVQKDRSNLPFVIHIGLDGVRSKLIEIETTASNQVILSSDGRGEPVSNDKTLGHQFNNPIDVEALGKSLGTEFLVSHNAGTYLCNYIYYRGLENIGTKTRGCIFLHIPHFSTLSLEKQVKQTIDLIHQIAKIPELL